MKIYVDYGIMNFGHAPLRLEIYLSKEEWRSVHSIPHIHGDVFLADIRGNQIKELEIPDDFISLYGWRRWAGKTEHIQIKNLVEGDCIEFVGYPRRGLHVTWGQLASIPISVNINKEFDKRDLLSKYSHNQILGWDSKLISSFVKSLVFVLFFFVLALIFKLMST